MKKHKFLTFLVSLLFFFSAVYGFFTVSVFAAPQLELNYPGLPAGIPKVPDFIAWMFKFALGASGALAFGVLVFGGIKYITSAGNASAQGDAKQWIQGALLGLLLLLGSVLILGTINPSLTTFGVPPAPSFNINAPSGVTTVTLDQSTYQSCLSGPTIAPGTCGCVVRNRQLLSSSITCPSFFDPPSGLYPSGQTVLYCPNPEDLCVVRTNAVPVPPFIDGQREILCCNVNVYP